MSKWSVRRRHPRYPIKLPVLYKLDDPSSAKPGVGWTRDLSEGGSCLELVERLEASVPLKLFLRTDKGGIELDAEVIWAKGQGSAGQGALHGVAFTHLDEAERQALHELFLQKGHTQLEGLRLPLEFPVSCQTKGTTGPHLQGCTGDISRGGLLLLLPEVFPPGTIVRVTLTTARGPVEAEGTIVWVGSPEEHTPGNLIRHGLRFTDISFPNQMTLGLLLGETP